MKKGSGGEEGGESKGLSRRDGDGRGEGVKAHSAWGAIRFMWEGAAADLGRGLGGSSGAGVECWIWTRDTTLPMCKSERESGLRGTHLDGGLKGLVRGGERDTRAGGQV